MCRKIKKVPRPALLRSAGWSAYLSTLKYISELKRKIIGIIHYRTVQYSTLHYKTVQQSTLQLSRVECSLGCDTCVQYGSCPALLTPGQNCTLLYFTVEKLYCCVILMYCTVLYCIVLFFAVLYYTILYCIVLYCIVLYCSQLYCTVLYCILPSSAQVRTLHSPYTSLLYSTVLYCILYYSIVLYYTLLCLTLL